MTGAEHADPERDELAQIIRSSWRPTSKGYMPPDENAERAAAAILAAGYSKRVLPAPPHREVETAGWDTKLRCTCGFEAATRREMRLHCETPGPVYVLPADTAAKHTPTHPFGCTHTWDRPPGSRYATHVCNLEDGHASNHRCACGVLDAAVVSPKEL